MVENISKVQYLLAESKFVEAQKEVELILIQSKGSESTELLELYFESLKAQSRPLPSPLLLDLIEKLIPNRPDEAQKWLQQLGTIHKHDQQRLLIINMKIAELKGQTDLLYKHISDYQITRYENRIPNIPDFITALISKYYPNDFQLKLQRLAIDLLRIDLRSCENQIRVLILSCFERSSPRGTKEKIGLLYEVLHSAENLYSLELYRNFCYLIANGVKSKKELKKVIELVIFFDEYRFKVLLLNFLIDQNFDSVAENYASEIKDDKDYDYVYLDKFLPHLKKLFFQKTPLEAPAPEPELVIDLKVTHPHKATIVDELLFEISEEEELLTHMLKYQNLTVSESLDVAVSLYQSEFYFAALKASQIAYELSSTSDHKLKACYLKITCMLKTGDFRMALDHSLEALQLARTQNDILSFLYSQAEAHFKLKDYSSAKAVLKSILAIDSNYRLAREKLDLLNAI